MYIKKPRSHVYNETRAMLTLLNIRVYSFFFFISFYISSFPIKQAMKMMTGIHTAPPKRCYYPLSKKKPIVSGYKKGGNQEFVGHCNQLTIQRNTKCFQMSPFSLALSKSFVFTSEQCEHKKKFLSGFFYKNSEM